MFVKYPDLLVSDVLKVDKTYLPWCYYCLPNISFNDEVLSAMNITEKIEKPGISEQGWSRWKESYSEGFTEEQKFHGRMVFLKSKKKRDKARLIQAEKDTFFTKRQLQAINHGNMKNFK